MKRGGAAAVIMILAVAGATAAPSPAIPPSPPERPVSGPGGTGYPHAAAVSSYHGSGASAWWLFEPDDPPGSGAEVVLFLHGWMAIEPWIYGAWIHHLVRRGYTVVFPKYQTSALSPPSSFLPAIQESVRDFLREHSARGRDTRDLRWAVAGHSAGGLLAAGYASACRAAGLPAPLAVVCLEPGRTPSRPGGIGIPLGPIDSIHPETLLIAVAGDRDGVCGDRDARAIVRLATSVPRHRRAFVLVRSDSHGSPALAATHFSPCSVLPEVGDVSAVSTPEAALAAAAVGNLGVMRRFLGTDRGREWLRSPDRPELAESFEPPDASDWLLWWRLLDLALDEGFRAGLPDARRLDGRIRDAGRWSDGTPVRSPVVERP